MRAVLPIIRKLLQEDLTVGADGKKAIVQYLRQNWPDIAARAAASPTFMCVAGLPGSGKTAFIKKSGSSQAYVVIDPDKYRKYMPGYESLSSSEVVAKTKAFSDLLASLEMWAAIHAQSPICLQSTFCATRFWKDCFQTLSPYLSDRNYKKSMLILEQPKSVSFQAFVARSTMPSAEEPVARSADTAFFEEMSAQCDGSVQALLELGFFQTVHRFGRLRMDQEYEPIGGSYDIF